MISKKRFVIGSCCVYISFVAAIVVLPKRDITCELGESCISFCCAKGKVCDEVSIRNQYIRSHPDLKYDRKLTFGDLNCESERLTSKWNLNKHDSIETDDHFYDETEYCLKANGTDFDAFVCKRENNLKEWIEKGFAFIASIVTFGLLLTIVAIYAAFKDLRTMFGRLSMLFVVGLIIFHLPFFINEFVHLRMHTELSIMSIGFVFAYCWLTVMVFDMWWTLRYREDPSVAESSRRFVLYSIFSAALTTEILLRDFYFTDDSSYDAKAIALTFLRLVIIIYVITVLLNICFLTLASFTVFWLSLKTNHQDASRFAAEKERFWTCVQIFAVLLISSSIAMFLGMEQPIGGAFVGGVLFVFFDFMIFAIFVFKPSVRQILFNRYRTLENFLGD